MIEFWNETFLGPDSGDARATAADFVDLFAEVQAAAAVRFPSVRIGGFAFADGAMRDFIEGFPYNHVGLLFQVLERLAENGTAPDFLSCRWYGSPGFAEPYEATGSAGLTANLFQIADDLMAMDDTLQEAYGLLTAWYPEVSMPEALHISEWALRLPRDSGEFGVESGRFNHLLGAYGAAFLSAGMIWMQDQQLHTPIERSHFWRGRGPTQGLFHADRVSDQASPTEDEIRNVFFIRRPAAAMYLHAGMDTLSSDDLAIENLAAILPIGVDPGPFDARAAAAARVPVTALERADGSFLGRRLVASLGCGSAQGGT